MFRKVIAYLAINLKDNKSWRYMKKSQELFYGTREEMLEFQDAQFQKIILYAYEHTPYYRRVFDKIGLIDNGKVNKDKYDNIPILTKEIIRREGENLYSNEAKKRGAFNNTSGGSTGEPVKFIQDKEYFSCNFGNKMLFGVLNEKMPGEREIKLWGSERDILEGSIGIKEKCINWCYNRFFLNSFVLTEEIMQKYVEMINAKKPKQIWTYADSIYQIAKYINEKNLVVYSPQNIISTAGMLYDEMRDEIARAFKNSCILNQYGSRETGAVGIEVGEHRGIRVFDHAVKVEILNEKNQISDSGEGTLLITNLTNYSMPLIRYYIGDTGELSQNLEGYSGSFSLLKKLTGRTNSHFKREDGNLVHGEYITHLFYGKEWIENFKVIQYSYREVEFQIVLKNGHKENREELEMMKRDLRKVMGECQIKVTYLDEIPKLNSGKYQFVISEIV